MSKMQDILDDAETQWERGNSNGAFKRIVEAIKLLSKAQQQVMKDFDRLNSGLDDIPIGGRDK